MQLRHYTRESISVDPALWMLLASWLMVLGRKANDGAVTPPRLAVTDVTRGFGKSSAPLARATLAWVLAGWTFLIQAAVQILPPGHRPVPLGVHALVGGRVVVRPGEVIESATVVIREGFIEAVGANVKPPADARVWDLQGQTIYAGLIDPYFTLTPGEPPVSTRRTEPILTSGAINFYGVPGDELDPGNPGPGYELATIAADQRAVTSYSPDHKTLETMRELGFAAANVVPTKGILRGTSALVALGEENPNDLVIRRDVFQHVGFQVETAREGGYPGSLMGVVAAVRQAFFDAQHYAADWADFRQHPAHRTRPEFNPALEALGPAIGRQMPVVFEAGSCLMVERAARVARELGLDFYLLACGQEWRRPDLLPSVKTAFIVPLDFPSLPNLPEPDDWEDVSLDELRVWDWAAENPVLLTQPSLEIALTTYGLADRKVFRRQLQLALDRGLSENAALAALTVVPARLCGVADRLGTIEAGKVANLTVVAGNNYFEPDTKISGVWIDGRYYPTPPAAPEKGKSEDAKAVKPATEAAKSDALKPDKKAAARRDLLKARVARSPQAGRGPLSEPPAVLVRGATIWTCGPAGRLDRADLLVVGDKIKAVGPDLKSTPGLPSSTLIIEAQGKHLTPGLIDAHSHSMILGSVNEGTIPSSAMVRIGDVVNSETAQIHEQLAAGVTTVNLLHGSANPIGGQNCIIKLREGQSPEALKLPDAPPGIKFALGENVKQSSRSERTGTRFPQSRMGVQTFLANRFLAARQYLQEWETYQKSGGVAPRRNLELEALGEILNHQRWIHCHSYRQDEILMLLRLAERFGIQVGTLQHVLEGYKVADEIARHGAGASTFSDWWAYKFEVYDAIPYNGSLMRDRGVVVSFNSDSSDLARRLYEEAAKAVKYGGTPETEALKFVTLNPAKQLRLDQRLGSLEPGKDADFVLWSKPPLDSGTVCLETWIEGKKYFDREAETGRVSALEQERAALIEKAKKTLTDGGAEGRGAAESGRSSLRALELENDGIDRSCRESE